MSVRNGNTRTMCELCSKLTIKKPIRSHLRLSGTFSKRNKKNTRTTYKKMILEYVPEAPTKAVADGVIRYPPVNIFQKHHC